MTRQQGETLGDLNLRLEKQAKLCDYGNQINENLLDKHIALSKDQPMLMKTFTRAQVDLEWYLKEAQARETAAVTLKDMTGNTSLQEDRPESKIYKASQGTEGTCGNCGREYHNRNACPARGDKCLACGGLNHWKAMCRQKPWKKKDTGEARRHYSQKDKAKRYDKYKTRSADKDQPNKHRYKGQKEKETDKRKARYNTQKRRVKKAEAPEASESESESESNSASSKGQSSEDSDSESEAATQSSFE